MRLRSWAPTARRNTTSTASFDTEQARIDDTVGRIRTGALQQNLLGDDLASAPQRGWFWQLQELPDAPESRYLFPLLAGNDFQEGLKNFRDLAYLGSTLARWDENMVVYNDMIDAREKAYAERIPRTDELMASGSLDRLLARREAVEGRYNDVINTEDVASLGTPRQREQWSASRPSSRSRRFQRVKRRLPPVKAASHQGRAVLGPQAGFPRPVLPAAARTEVARQRAGRGEHALAEGAAGPHDAPTTTGDFASRIAALQARMGELRGRLVGAGEARARCSPISRCMNSTRRSSAWPTMKCRRASRWHPSTTALPKRHAPLRQRHRLRRRPTRQRPMRQPPPHQEPRSERAASGHAAGRRQRLAGAGSGQCAAGQAHAQGPAAAQGRGPQGRALGLQCRQGDAELP
jgi:hypothetical protein